MSRSETISHLILAIVISGLITLTGCGGGGSRSATTTPAPASFNADAARSSLTERMETLVAQDDNVINAAVLVELPEHEFLWRAGFGLADPDAAEAMTADHFYRIASISKTFTAALVLRLTEEGLLTLDDRLGDLLTDDDLPGSYTVGQLSVLDGAERGRDITIRQLLQHRSGLRDYIFDKKPDTDTSVLDDTLTNVLEEGGSGLVFDAESILTYYLDNWSTDPVFEPGGGYHYSDTGYALLGVIVQQVTALSLADAYREYIYTPLGIVGAYQGWHESAPADAMPLANHYFDLSNLGFEQNLNVTQINTSADWAGGGIVVGTEGQRQFLRALVAGELFESDATFEAMQDWQPEGPGGNGYGLGFDLEQVSDFETWGHNGFWGTEMVYLPDKDAIVVLTLNQVTSDPANLLEGIVEDLAAANW